MTIVLLVPGLPMQAGKTTGSVHRVDIEEGFEGCWAASSSTGCRSSGIRFELVRSKNPFGFD